MVRTFIVALLTTACAQAHADPCGRTVAEPRLTSGGTVAAAADALYWLGGSDGAPSTHARRFDLKTRRWTELPGFAIPRINAAAVVVGNKVILAGGAGASISSLDSVEIFDLARCTWSAGPRLPKPTSDAAAVAIGDKMILAGGMTSTGRKLHELDLFTTNAAVTIDPSGRIRSLPDMLDARERGGAVVVGTEVWFVGGTQKAPGPDADTRERSDVAVLDPASGRWSRGVRQDHGRQREGYAVALSDRTVVFMARSRDKPTIFEKDAWRTGSRDKRFDHLSGVVTVGDTIYVLGASFEGTDHRTEVYALGTYDPRKDAWQLVAHVGKHTR